MDRNLGIDKEFKEPIHHLLILFHNLYDLLAKLEDRTYSIEVGLSYQQSLVLITVESSDPPVSQTLIAKRLGRNLNVISTIVDRMVKQGLLIRVRSKKDRRETRVSLTPQGKDKLHKAIEVGNRLKERLGSMLSDSDIEESMKFLVNLRSIVHRELDGEITPDWDENANRIMGMLKHGGNEIGQEEKRADIIKSYS
jgi:MarR family transcriptional regulator, transcriptional regulator for hemolysin